MRGIPSLLLGEPDFPEGHCGAYTHHQAVVQHRIKDAFTGCAPVAGTVVEVLYPVIPSMNLIASREVRRTVGKLQPATVRQCFTFLSYPSLGKALQGAGVCICQDPAMFFCQMSPSQQHEPSCEPADPGRLVALGIGEATRGQAQPHA